MKFPKIKFDNESACFDTLFEFIHPEGMHCPNPKCGARDEIRRKQNHPQPWRVRYRCRHCGRSFNAWTGTPLQGTHRPPSEILQIMKANVEGESTLQLSQETEHDWKRLAAFRHKLQPLVLQLFGSPRKKHRKQSESEGNRKSSK